MIRQSERTQICVCIYIYIYIYIYVRANDSSAPTKSAQCQGGAKLLMKLFKKQANFVLPMVSWFHLNKNNFACLMIVL